MFRLDHVQSVSEGNLLPHEGSAFPLILLRVELQFALGHLQVKDVVALRAGSEDESLWRVSGLVENSWLLQPELGVFSLV